MRTATLLSLLLLAPVLRAAEPSATAMTSAAAADSARLARVAGWMRKSAPSAPPEIILAAAQQFLDELRRSRPEMPELIASGAADEKLFETSLLRHLNAQLGPAHDSLRETLAARRLALTDGSDPADTQASAEVLAKIKALSKLYHRRIVEGRIDDDELVALVRRVKQGPAQATPVSAAAKPKELTAADLVSEFSRRHQNGSALQRLRAYALEGTLYGAAGEQTVQIFRLRPDRFRLHVRAGAETRYILAGDGTGYWHQAPGAAPQPVSADTLGDRRQLAEFANPLFGDERCRYERLPDGDHAGKKTHRLAILRPDGTRYVAVLDPETFHEIAGEFEDGSRAAYSDFREAAGLTLAFRVETTDPKGVKNVFQINRLTPNPGLLEAFFRPGGDRQINFFSLEHLTARSTAAVAAPVPAATAPAK